MEMHQVRYVLAAIDHGGFTRAATACHVSQPALTKAVKRLEEELESPLFVRAASGVSLTEFGRILVPKLRAIAARDADIKDIARNVKRLRTIPVRIGVLQTIGARKISSYVERFLRAAPEAEVECLVDTHATLIAMLEDGRVDLMISNFAYGNTGSETDQYNDLPPWCVIKSLYDERYCIVLPPGHNLAEQDAIDIGELHGEAHVDRIACEMRDLLQAELGKKEVNFYPAIRTDREHWVESLVAQGIGFAIMPEFSAQSPQAILRPCADLALSRTISIARSCERPTTPVAQKLWQVIRTAEA